MNLWIVLIGFLGGLVGGLFGVGGGLIYVPLLVLLLKFDAHLAVGTSLAVIVPTALIGAAQHARAGMIDWKAAAFLAVFSMAGAWAGASMSLGTESLMLRRLFGFFLVFLALKMFFSK